MTGQALLSPEGLLCLGHTHPMKGALLCKLYSLVVFCCLKAAASIVGNFHTFGIFSTKYPP